MPTNAVVKRILSAIETDTSKVLGVSYNGKAITTKEYIKNAGRTATPAQVLFSDPLNRRSVCS
jgi:hypothetical protein